MDFQLFQPPFDLTVQSTFTFENGNSEIGTETMEEQRNDARICRVVVFRKLMRIPIQEGALDLAVKECLV